MIISLVNSVVTKFLAQSYCFRYSCPCAFVNIIANLPGPYYCGGSNITFPQSPRFNTEAQSVILSLVITVCLFETILSFTSDNSDHGGFEAH